MANYLSATIQADIVKQKQPTNNGGFTSGKSELADAVHTAIINKCAGGMGLISGRKAFQRPMADGVQLLNAIQDVCMSKEVTVA